MRLQEIYEKLMAGKVDSPIQNFGSGGLISDVQELRTRLELMGGIPGFEREEESLRSSIIFRTILPRIHIPQNEWELVNGIAAMYLWKLQGLKKYLEAELGRQNREGVFVKLPPTEDLQEIIRLETKIANALGQLILIETVGGELKLKSWEKGSLWLELTVGGPSVVLIVGSAVWAAAVIFKKFQEGRIVLEHVNSLKLKNESLQNILEAQEQMLNLALEAEAKNIAAQYLQGEVKPETIERIKFSIKEMSELIEKGAEIHPALNAPENVRNLFPDFKKLLLIDSKTKLLEKGDK